MIKVNLNSYHRTFPKFRVKPRTCSQINPSRNLKTHVMWTRFHHNKVDQIRNMSLFYQPFTIFCRLIHCLPGNPTWGCVSPLASHSSPLHLLSYQTPSQIYNKIISVIYKYGPGQHMNMNYNTMEAYTNERPNKQQSINNCSFPTAGLHKLIDCSGNGVTGGRKSFSRVETSTAEATAALLGVKVMAADMPQFMQAHAFRCARRAYDGLDKFSSRQIAHDIKKVQLLSEFWCSSEVFFSKICVTCVCRSLTRSMGRLGIALLGQALDLL